MSVNQAPIYSRQGELSTNNGIVSTANMSYSALLTATADYTGVSVNHLRVYKADANNGGFVQRLRFKAKGTNVATVARIYINNGGDHTVANNNAFFGEQSLPATTATNTAGTADVDYPLNIALNAGFEIWVGVATTVASGWICTAVGGQY